VGGKSNICLCKRCIRRSQGTRRRSKVPAPLHPTPPHARTYTRTHPHARTYTRKETRNETHPPRLSSPREKSHAHAHAHLYACTYVCVYAYACTYVCVYAYAHLWACMRVRVSFSANVTFNAQTLTGCAQGENIPEDATRYKKTRFPGVLSRIFASLFFYPPPHLQPSPHR